MFSPCSNELHEHDIVAENDGFIAVLPFHEMRILFRKFPKELFRLSEIAARKALETLSKNVSGETVNPAIQH